MYFTCSLKLNQVFRILRDELKFQSLVDSVLTFQAKLLGISHQRLVWYGIRIILKVGFIFLLSCLYYI